MIDLTKIHQLAAARANVAKTAGESWPQAYDKEFSRLLKLTVD